ncbi:unnamed protein product [Notodromas monacha]|uniref:Amino acid transporter n=1 Tax=Notodromas monacha TaxID=399045 RepID=A0A7R9GIC8_9CRUS|nr:unnamed protein product [Notodromas monacha]CAG0922307.1 unnamed protein product [Notodromas monacha]
MLRVSACIFSFDSVSLVSAVSGLDLSLSGKIGMRAVAYYMLTTVMAVILGLILVSTIHPGQGNADDIHREGGVRNITTADTLMDLVRNVFPPNVVQAAVFSYRTKLIPPPPPSTNDDDGWVSSTSSRTPITSLYDLSSEHPEMATPMNNGNDKLDHKSLYNWEIKGSYEEGTNIMGLVMFSFILGVTLCKMGSKGKPLHDFFACLAEAMMVITNWVIMLSPIGVFFLIAGQLLEMNDFGVIVGQLGMYFVTVLVGLFFHGFIVLPTIYGLATRTLPFRFVLNMTEAGHDLAFFVYSGVWKTEMALIRGFPDSSCPLEPLLTWIAGIPQAGLVTLVMVLDTVGLPAEDVSLIVAVDWLLDRFRTAINVLGDALGAGIVAHLSQKELDDSTAAHKSRKFNENEDEEEEEWDKINGQKYNRALPSDVEAAGHVELTAM